MSVLSLRDIHRWFGPKVHALRGVSLSANAGEVLGLVGKNGAGKTTLLNVALGLLHAQGNVEVFGLDPWEHAVEVKRRVGFVADESAFPRAKLQQLLDLHRALYATWDNQLAQRLLGPLARDTSMRMHALSKGQARRVMLTCAMAHRPELLLLDEPAGGLDPSARREFLELAIELLNDAGTTIVFSSHHMPDVERIATRVVFIDAGQKLLDSELDALKENYCVALLPSLTPPQLSKLNGLPGFVRHRTHGGTLHVVFAQGPEVTAEALGRTLQIEGARCTRVNLDDLFVDLVGNDQ